MKWYLIKNHKQKSKVKREDTVNGTAFAVKMARYDAHNKMALLEANKIDKTKFQVKEKGRQWASALGE